MVQGTTNISNYSNGFNAIANSPNITGGGNVGARGAYLGLGVADIGAVNYNGTLMGSASELYAGLQYAGTGASQTAWTGTLEQGIGASNAVLNDSSATGTIVTAIGTESIVGNFGATSIIRNAIGLNVTGIYATGNDPGQTHNAYGIRIDSNVIASGGTTNNVYSLYNLSTAPSYFAGNIGIGTTSPYSLLSVSNSVTTAANTPLFTIASTTGGTSTTTVMTVLANGDVAIGTTTPVPAKLVIQTVDGADGNSYQTPYALMLEGDGTAFKITNAAGTLQRLLIGHNIADTAGYAGPLNSNFIYSSNNPLALTTAGQPVLVGTSPGGGDLGIGTTSPYSLLSISNSVTTPANTPLFTIASTTGGTSTTTVMTVLANGNVGIGTANPNEAVLQIQSPAVNTTGMKIKFGTNNVLALHDGAGSEHAGEMYLWDNNVVNTYITASPSLASYFNAGKVGIGTTTPYARLEVWGPDSGATTTAFSVVNNASTTAFAVYDNGNATYAGSIFQSSDQRLKTAITPLDASSSLAAIEALTPVSYTRIDQPGSGQNLGFIAQAVQTIFPQLVSTTSATALTPDGTLTLNYVGLVAPMVRAIQALAGQVSSLAATVAGFAQSFVSQNITATQHLCVKKSDGSNVCITGDELNTLLNQSGQSAIIITDVPAPTSPQASQGTASDTPATSTPSTGSGQAATTTDSTVTTANDTQATTTTDTATTTDASNQ
jgi:hypothetical protein